MISIFDKQNVTFENPKYSLEVRHDGFTYTNKSKDAIDVSFDEILTINLTRYCNSNSSYIATFYYVDPQKKNFDITLDANSDDRGHNIKETKTLLVAYAAHKLSKDFPNNIGDCEVTLGVSLKEKQIKLYKNKIVGAKHEIDINQIKRVVCVAGGALNNFAIYKSETKKGFFDKPDMSVPVNSITAPLLEAIVTKNTGKGIDFSRGNGFDLKTSEFIIIRFMDSGFFISADGTFKEEWQKTAFDRVAAYGYAVEG